MKYEHDRWRLLMGITRSDTGTHGCLSAYPFPKAIDLHDYDFDYGGAEKDDGISYVGPVDGDQPVTSRACSTPLGIKDQIRPVSTS